MTDAATSKRKFPAYTTAQLKEIVAKAGDAANPVMVQEIADREAGVSKAIAVPQVHSFTYRPLLIGR